MKGTFPKNETFTLFGEELIFGGGGRVLSLLFGTL